MLNTLRRIVQQINEAQDFDEALRIIVGQVRKAMGTHVCSVYLRDRELSDFVLMATEGLNPEAVGQVRLSESQGLVGLVAVRAEPVNLDQAPSHPEYIYFPETGEERYSSFLGVPIIHHREVLGVLVIQQQDSRRFDEGEEAFLITLSAQLAGVIAHAEATGAIHLSDVGEQSGAATFGGISGAKGIAIGTAMVVYPPADLDAVPDCSTDDIDAEIVLFRQALARARAQIVELSERMAQSLPPEELALFDVYLRILEGDCLGLEIEDLIQTGEWAQGALRKVINQHINLFESMDDAYLRERAVDIRDLGRRLLAQLQAEKSTQAQYPENTILVGEEVTAAQLAEVPTGRLKGIVSVQGSSNSHVAILARALDIPTVMGVEEIPVKRVDGRPLIVDGYQGRVLLSPSEMLLREFSLLKQEAQKLSENLQSLRDLPAETPDGYRVPLLVNAGLMAELSSSLESGAEGIGLYRTEIPFMIRDRFPGEDEQRRIYRELLEAYAPRPVTMRTLDIGGDKALSYFPVKEDNPFLGWRGIRISLDHPEIFAAQIRAMLRANEGLGNLRIMLPMISGLEEVEEVMAAIKRCYDEVKDEGVTGRMPHVGVMIEVPSAVYQAGDIAELVDFMSVGSNDLTQYLLAVDRNNPRVANLYDSLHPAVLKALHHVACAGARVHRPVGICGELAGDPVAAILLVAMGYSSLSMNATSLARVKWVIRNFPMSQARQLLQHAMAMKNGSSVREHLEDALETAGLGGLFRAGG